MRAAAIMRSCPFCGEAEHLSGGNSITRPLIVDGDTLKGQDGDEVLEEVEAVHCRVCEAMAPLDVWNGDRPPSAYAILRDFDPPSGVEAGAREAYLAKLASGEIGGPDWSADLWSAAANPTSEVSA